MGGAPNDISNDYVDVFVTLEDDNDTEYWFEVTTPEALSSQMDERNRTFLEPSYPPIIVHELTVPVIKEAIEALLIEEDDAYWFKLYYSSAFLTTEDLDLIIDRHLREIEKVKNKSKLE